MTQGNGTAGLAHLPQPPNETAKFVIGGQTIEVPALTMWTIDKVGVNLRSMGPDTPWMDYARHCLVIIHAALEEVQPELTLEVLSRACTMGEMREMPSQMLELFRVSGFTLGEVSGTSEERPGTPTHPHLPLN